MSTIRQLRTNFLPNSIITILKSKLYNREKYSLLNLCILFVVEIERFNKNAVYKSTTLSCLYLTFFFFFLNFNKTYKKFSTSNFLSNVKYNICQISPLNLKRSKANDKILSYYFILFYCILAPLFIFLLLFFYFFSSRVSSTSNSLSNVKYNICQTSSSNLKRPKVNVKILSYYFILFYYILAPLFISLSLFFFYFFFSRVSSPHFLLFSLSIFFLITPLFSNTQLH